MNRLDRMQLIKLAVRDLDDAVQSFMTVYGERENWRSDEAIKRRIIQIRADLKKLEEELKRPVSRAEEGRL